jgi:hypothetical protein
MLRAIALVSSLVSSTGYAATLEETRAAMESHLAGCAERTGYDRESGAGLADDQLHPDERAYLSCAYEGIRRILIPGAANPQAYDDLMVEYQRMTDAVAAGRLTRADRRARAEALLADVRKKEDEEAAQRTADLGRQGEAAKESHEQARTREKLTEFTDTMMRQTLSMPPPRHR